MNTLFMPPNEDQQMNAGGWERLARIEADFVSMKKHMDAGFDGITHNMDRMEARYEKIQSELVLRFESLSKEIAAKNQFNPATFLGIIAVSISALGMAAGL